MKNSELLKTFHAYIGEFTEQFPIDRPNLIAWLRWRIGRAKKKAEKVRDLTDAHASQIYADMIAAFPLETVPLDRPDLPIAPVPYQVPFSVTPELADYVCAKLHMQASGEGVPSLTTQRVMEILIDASHREFPPGNVDNAGGSHQEQFWARIDGNGLIDPHTLSALKKDVPRRKGYRVALVELKEVK